MKQLTILLFILHISLFTSCQNKSEADDAPYTFQFDGKDYSYKGYEIIPGTEESRVFPLAIGDSGLIYYYAYEFGTDMDPDQIGYKLDSVTLQRIENIWNKDSINYSSLPIFDKKLHIDKISNVNFLLKGFKRYNHQFQELRGVESANMIEINDKEFKFSYKGEYRIKRDYKQDNNDEKMAYDYNISLQHGDKTQYFLKSADKIRIWNVEMTSIGDYDEDGKIDFILRVDDDQEEATYIYFLLYLSSEAEEGELVKHVATGVVRQTLQLLKAPITIKGGDIEIRH